LHPENGIAFNRSAFFQEAQAPRTPRTSWRDVDDRMHLSEEAVGVMFTGTSEARPGSKSYLVA
jgi:hypothetical protein